MDNGLHPLIWGYVGGVVTIILFQSAVILITLLKWYGLIGLSEQGRP